MLMSDATPAACFLASRLPCRPCTVSLEIRSSPPFSWGFLGVNALNDFPAAFGSPWEAFNARLVLLLIRRDARAVYLKERPIMAQMLKVPTDCQPFLKRSQLFSRFRSGGGDVCPFHASILQLVGYWVKQ